jgi:CRP-like cAMP-binding protein
MAKSQFSDAFANVILAQLSHERLTDLRQHLQRVELEVRKVIYEPNRPIDFAYFVETGMISVVSIMNDGASIEVGTIGKEGMTGACVLLGAKSVPYQHFVQIAGFGYSMKAETLKSEAAHNGEFRDLIFRSHSAFQTQAMQAAACNGLHSISQRCCRWILMSQDRIASDTVPLTHEFLGIMLGARRASVTDVLRPLQDRGWIHSKRGEITILDRKGLESGSCECYRVITNQQKQLMN